MTASTSPATRSQLIVAALAVPSPAVAVRPLPLPELYSLPCDGPPLYGIERR
jgi:hypothetical protein